MERFSNDPKENVLSKFKSQPKDQPTVQIIPCVTILQTVPPMFESHMDEGVYLLMALRHASQALGPTQIYASLASKKTIAVEKLKAGQVYLSTCPFKKISSFFANKMIEEAASKATTLGVDWQNTVNGLVYL
ncbi:unnamed protein product [Fraxinus pennsylvanica]|uniref:Uncharacterized protein n=1 Tax=Fraxinus pennsylvanica TaxID=56036 RepID=A0AAD1ZDN4_9LAMI|nr:unnamed protein product [Fraxinus pennsylvanica]